MLGLDYDSSSEDEGQDQKPVQPAKTEVPKQLPVKPGVNETTAPSTEHPQSKSSAQQPQPTVPADAPLLGPSLPPDLSQSHLPSTNDTTPTRTSSPFSTTRALIRDMTLPPLPNLDIPPSPPGSPDPTANKKFAHFLSLKENGVHFNEKLSSSSSLRNPSLLSKMMEHAGIDRDAQYATSLPREIWDVSRLPAWGFKEELNKSQQEIRKRREGQRREAVEFVPAGAAAEGSRGGTPAGGRKGGRESSRRAELERRPRRDRSRSPGRRRRSRSR